MTVEIDNLNFGYTIDSQVLNQISLKVNGGSFHCIIGISGCGKTTLLKIIAGLINQDKISGTIKIGDSSISEAMMRSDISYMFQEHALMPNLTVQENIELPFLLRRTEIDNSVEELIALVGLSDHVNKLPREISGGMNSRVALARSFVTKPKLLLLDEPFSSLDEFWRTNLYEKLKELKNIYGVTIIMVTHNLYEAISLSDFITVLGIDGRVHAEYDLKSMKKEEGEAYMRLHSEIHSNIMNNGI